MSESTSGAARGATQTPAFTYCFKVFGCQMNVADANDLELTLRLRGGSPVETEADADLVLVNTCVVRQKAEDKAYSYIGMLKAVKDARPGAFLTVMGCLVPKSREHLAGRFPFVDLLVDYSAPDTVVEALDNSFPPMRDSGGAGAAIRDALTADPRVLSGEAKVDEFMGAPEIGSATAISELKKSGLVTIIRGCNYRCTYCIVPKVRGREISIPPEVIVADVRRKHEMGYRMITLLGQNVLTYGDDREGCPDFAGLVERVLDETEVPWLHFLTSHPRDLSDEFVARIYKHDRMLNSLHLPFQAGSDRILKRMLRLYTRDYFLSRVDAVRSARPDIFLSTDVIVGFPGETREDFEETLSMMRRVRFNDAYMFKFSPREGTPATRLPDEVPEAEKKARLAELIALQHEIGREENRKYVGRKYRGLVEDVGAGGGSRKPTAIVRLPINKPAVVADAPDDLAVGDWVDVEVTNVRNSTFDAEFV
ncbi:MAG: tRNA (N6-isopentenyl adenosine(37)-C2)-methylthiotransferase MiaB [bacterium]